MTEKHIAAIETHYAGCRFRSRLEARWAVVFDTLGINWEYEPQGLIVGDRLDWNTYDDESGKWPYLPDFWLPDFELWCEVKGSLTLEEHVHLLNAAAYISSNGGGGCHDNGGNDVIVLGPIPRPDIRSAWPIRLHMHKGDLLARGWCFGIWGQDPHDYKWSIADDSGNYDLEFSLTDGWSEKLPEAVIHAYTKGRSARFEHGETPDTTIAN